MHLAFFLLVSIFATTAPAAAYAADIWKAMREPGHVVLMRHALAPGTGDPASLTIGDCTTQRNLSDSGREQARKTGNLFRANGITEAHVYSSQWCRTLETAELLSLGPVEPLPSLNSFFGAPERREPQMAQLRQDLATITTRAPVVLVTHQVVISALAGRMTRSGEMVVVRIAGNEIQVVGTIEEIPAQ